MREITEAMLREVAAAVNKAPKGNWYPFTALTEEERALVFRRSDC